jgi:hyperosmotically inducible protein
MALLLGVTGCETSSSGPKDERSEGRVVDDKQITADVEKRLKQEPVYKMDGVDVATFGGIVQLHGFVNTEQQKQRAGEVAQRVPGVSQVMNALTIKPEPTSTTNGLPRIYSE